MSGTGVVPPVDTLVLETTAIVLSALCGLFGIYFVLFILSIWSTYRHANASSKKLRVVTIVLFVTLSIHFIVRVLQFARARRLDDSEEELLKWGIPLLVIGNVTTTFSGLCSDGLLAWRFWVIFGRRPWAKWIPGILVVVNALLCWSADAQHLAIYKHHDFYENVLYDVTLKITAAWGWLLIFNNTVMTSMIVWKILSVSGSSNGHTTMDGGSRYQTVIQALVESAAVTWVGVFVYEVCSLAPQGGISDHYDVGYVMACILPAFFGISQCLITFRLGFTRELASDGKTLPSSAGSAFMAARRPGFSQTGSSGAYSSYNNAPLSASYKLTSPYGNPYDIELSGKQSPVIAIQRDVQYHAY